MPHYCPQYQANETGNTYCQTFVEGELPDLAAGKLFGTHGVSPGDLAHTVTVIGDVLLLLDYGCPSF